MNKKTYIVTTNLVGTLTHEVMANSKNEALINFQKHINKLTKEQLVSYFMLNCKMKIKNYSTTILK